MALSILAGRDRISLENGFDLRLLSALEILQARREGEELSGDGGERALCSNACLLARALERTEDRTPVFQSGREVLAGLTVAEIAALAAQWSAFSRESDPGPELDGERLEMVKKTPRGLRRAAALAGAEGISCPAHRETGAGDEGQELSVVSD